MTRPSSTVSHITSEARQALYHGAHPALHDMPTAAVESRVYHGRHHELENGLRK